MIRKYINRYTLKKALPTITTAAACGGIFLTGFLAAKEMRDYMNGVDTSTASKVKHALPPVLAGLGTMSLVIFTRCYDAKVIASFAAAETVFAKQLNDTHHAIKELYGEEALYNVKNKVCDYQDVDCEKREITIEEGPDVQIYYEPNLDLYFKCTNETIRSAFERLNRNYQIRGGLASLYEWVRFLGITKDNIHALGLDWCEWVGWHGKFMCENGFSWIDDIQHNEGECIVIDWMCPFMPISCDPPVYIHNMCHTDEFDTEDLDDNSILEEIRSEIQDEMVA